MPFMELEITRKGTYISADCPSCWQTIDTHEWASWEFNNEAEAIRSHEVCCSWCEHNVELEEHYEHKAMYAGRYSAPGYLDCTEWSYDTNKRRLEKELRYLYA